jgi:2-polyprenyl-6-methoxyphenol hydroxylase-like FAD-dependent oxidoreductase
MTSFIPIENVRFSKRLTEIEQHPDKVVLEFADGDVAEASVLAGADGIQSGVRKHVLELVCNGRNSTSSSVSQIANHGSQRTP